MTHHPRHPRRQRKTDRLLTPDASVLEIRCDMMLAPFDHAMTAMEEKWGIDRLPELVSVETADKWGSAMGKLNAAIAESNPEDVKARVGVALRGLAALDAEALAAGHVPKSPDVWECEVNGRVFSVIKEGRDHKAMGDIKGRRIYTMREVALALDAMDHGMLRAAKDAFEGAHIISITKATKPVFDDEQEIPF